MPMTKFKGWLIECPNCRHQWHIADDDLAVEPIPGEQYAFRCELCKQKFYAVCEDR